jgi:hypothetical protein
VALVSIGDAVRITVKTVNVDARADGVQLNIQHSVDVTVTEPACVGIFSGATVLAPSTVAGGTMIGCFFLSGDVSGPTGDVMSFKVRRVGTGNPLITFGLAGQVATGFGTEFSDAGKSIGPGAVNTLQVTQAAASIAGTVTLQGRTATSPAGVGHGIATVTLNPGNLVAIVGVNGSFQFTNVAAGTFTLTATAPGYVSRHRTNVVVAGSPVTVPTVQLRCGLVDSNLFVNINDITATVASFGKTLPTRVDALGRFVDQNGDGFVNINDITCVVSGFGTTSPQPWP